MIVVLWGKEEMSSCLLYQTAPSPAHVWRAGQFYIMADLLAAWLDTASLQAFDSDSADQGPVPRLKLPVVPASLPCPHSKACPPVFKHSVPPAEPLP